MARRKKHEEHVNAEAWAIPYGDLVTLLFALFTVMYAVSSVNEGKFRVLSDSMIAAFHGAPKSVHPINIGEKDSGKRGDKNLTGVSPTVLAKVALPKGNETPTAQVEVPGLPDMTAADKDPGALISMERQVQDAMQSLIAAKQLTVRRHDLWLEIQINTDLLFPSGSGSFAPQAEPVVDKLAEVLKPFTNPIRVEGHTDDRPIRTAAFPSNWELSAARSASVVHEFTKAGVDPMRLEIVGFGEFRPLQPNDSIAGRNANRRVSILVLDASAAGSAAAFAAASAAGAVPASLAAEPTSSATAAPVGSAGASSVHPVPGPAAAGAVPTGSPPASGASTAGLTSASGAPGSFARAAVPPGKVGLAPSAHAGTEKTVLTKPTGKPE